jgi:ribosomal protein S18 acetylase RimI-like enzyme
MYPSNDKPTELKIRKATIEDLMVLSELSKTTFIESHGNSASESDIQDYVRTNYTVEKFKDEITDLNNHYYLIFFKDEAVGFSKICLNSVHQSLKENNVAKLERLYILQKHHDQAIGFQIFKFNVSLCQKNNQAGMWLNVWTKNTRAINFYDKLGFEKIGNYSFKISPTHSNPNHQLYLKF